MNYKKIFAGKMEGPFEFRYQRNSKQTRLCYIITGYESQLYSVYCPEVTLPDNSTLYAEYNLAKRIKAAKNIFVAFGKDNYLTLK